MRRIPQAILKELVARRGLELDGIAFCENCEAHVIRLKVGPPQSAKDDKAIADVIEAGIVVGVYVDECPCCAEA